jgi:hypothetical protein
MPTSGPVRPRAQRNSPLAQRLCLSPRPALAGRGRATASFWRNLFGETRHQQLLIAKCVKETAKNARFLVDSRHFRIKIRPFSHVSESHTFSVAAGCAARARDRKIRISRWLRA